MDRRTAEECERVAEQVAFLHAARRPRTPHDEGAEAAALQIAARIRALYQQDSARSVNRERVPNDEA